MASPRGRGCQPHASHDDRERAAAPDAGPQLDGLHAEATDAFQQAPVQQASGSTSRQRPQTLNCSSASRDVSRNLLQIPSSARHTPEAKRHKPQGLAGRQRSSTLVQLGQPPAPHTFLAGALASATSHTSDGAEFGTSARHVYLSTEQGHAAGVRNVGGVGTAVHEVAASEGLGAGGSSFGQQQQHLPAPQQFLMQEGATDGVLQQPPPAAGGAGDQLDALMPSPAAGGNEAGDEEEEDDSDACGAPIGIPMRIPIPSGVVLNARSWCCSGKAVARSICSGCQKRWHCHINHGLIDLNNERFTCCNCNRRLKGGCRCHA